MTKQYYIEFEQQMIVTDKEGYLTDSQAWSKPLVEHIAERESIELTPEHWQVILFVREFYEKYDTSPAIRVLVKALQQEYGIEKGNSRYLYWLFPKGPAKIATKLAGLPKPAKCL